MTETEVGLGWGPGGSVMLWAPPSVQGTAQVWSRELADRLQDNREAALCGVAAGLGTGGWVAAFWWIPTRGSCEP